MRCRSVLLFAGLAGGLCAVPFGIRAVKACHERHPLADGSIRRTVPSGLQRDGAVQPEKNASPVRPSPQARERAEAGIGRIERIVAERKMPTRAAEAFRTQMALRLAASGADRAVVKAWLDRTVPATPVRPIAKTAVAAEPGQSPFDLSSLTPEEREVIGMNANFIHASTRQTTVP